jgi:hypothetical protein
MMARLILDLAISISILDYDGEGYPQRELRTRAVANRLVPFRPATNRYAAF